MNRNGRERTEDDVAEAPSGAGRFAPVVQKIHEEGTAAGFRHARDMLFERFEVFSKKMAPYAVLKLAIELDRHALYCDLVAEKQRGRADESTWTEYQKYLQGEVSVAPMAGTHVPRSVRVAGLSVNPDEEPDIEPKEDD